MSFVHLLSECKNKKAIFKETDEMFRRVADLFIAAASLAKPKRLQHAKNNLYPFLLCFSHFHKKRGSKQSYKIHFPLHPGWTPLQLSEYNPERQIRYHVVWNR